MRVFVCVRNKHSVHINQGSMSLDDADKLSDVVGKMQPLKDSLERYMREKNLKQHETPTMIFKLGPKTKRKQAPFNLKNVAIWLEDYTGGADILEYLKERQKASKDEAKEDGDEEDEEEEEFLKMSKKRKKKGEE